MSDDEFGKDIQQETPVCSDGGHSLIDRVFGALAHQRRRYVLYYLRDHKRAETGDLAVQIVAWEQDVSIDEVPAEAANEVSTQLVHSHLPKLAKYNLVEYDRRSGSVCYNHPPSLLEKLLDLAATVENLD